MEYAGKYAWLPSFGSFNRDSSVGNMISNAWMGMLHQLDLMWNLRARIHGVCRESAVMTADLWADITAQNLPDVKADSQLRHCYFWCYSEFLLSLWIWQLYVCTRVNIVPSFSPVLSLIPPLCLQPHFHGNWPTVFAHCLYMANIFIPRAHYSDVQ